MTSSQWQKQHIHFRTIVWSVSAAISILLIIIMVSLGFSLEVASIFFLVVFAVTRVSLAFILKNRYANTMVRILKFDYEEIEHDFRMVFKNNNVRFSRKTEEDAYCYDFPGYNLSMTVQPYWLSSDMSRRPVTKVTLSVLSEANTALAERLAASIDEMATQRANNKAESVAAAKQG